MLPQSFDAAVEAARASLASFANGDHRPGTELWSPLDDVVLNNPFGPPIVGFERVQAERARRASMFVAGGGPTGFEEFTRWSNDDVGYIVAIEHGQVRRPDSDDLVPVSLRVTTIFRREDDGWRICVRHADNVTAAR